MTAPDLDQLLRTALDDRAREVPDAAARTVTPVAVLARSRRLRRRQQTRAAASVVLAAGVVAGVVVVPAWLGGRSTEEPPSAPSTPTAPVTGPSSASSSTSPTGAASLPPIVSKGFLAGLPLAPRTVDRVDYVAGDVLVRADGSEVTLPSLPRGVAYADAARLPDGWVLTRDAVRADGAGGSPAMVLRVDDRGRLLEAHPGGATIAVGSDGSVAWWEATSQLHVVAPDGQETGATAAAELVRPGKDLEPVGLLHDGAVVLRRESGRGVIIETSSTGPGHPSLAADLRYVRGVDGVHDLVAGDRGDAPPAEHGAVTSATDGHVVFSSDRWAVFGFSDDGRYVAGLSSVTGGDPDAVAALDAADGSVVGECPLGGPDRPVFPDGLAVGNDGALTFEARGFVGDTGTAALVRCDRDGTLTRLSPVFRTRAFSPYGAAVLAVR